MAMGDAVICNMGMYLRTWRVAPNNENIDFHRPRHNRAVVCIRRTKFTGKYIAYNNHHLAALNEPFLTCLINQTVLSVPPSAR